MGALFLVTLVSTLVSVVVLVLSILAVPAMIIAVLGVVITVVSVELLDPGFTVFGLPFMAITRAQNECRHSCK